MGGSGSGFNGTRKAAVEDGLTLDISSLVRKGALIPGKWTRGRWSWNYPGKEPHAHIGYEANLIDPDAATIRLIYTVRGEPMDCVVHLVWTEPRYGGRRWWFLCPLVRRDGGPPRRVAKLHLPPGGRYFGSRETYRLAYRSSQENGKFRSLHRRLAAQMGTDAATIRAALKTR